MERHAVEIDPFAQHVTGRARDVRDDRRVPSGQGVEKRGLACVRRPGEHDRHAIGEQGAPTGFFAQGREIRTQCFDPPLDVSVSEEVHLLVGEVDGGFDVDAQGRGGIHERADALAEDALQGLQGSCRCLPGRGVDEVRDRLRLGEVQAIVEEGAFGEFTGSCDASAEVQTGAKHRIEHGRSTVSLQFDDVLAGEGRGSAEGDGDAVVEGKPVPVAEDRMVSVPRAEGSPGQGLADTQRFGSRQAHDADTAATRCRRDGGDRVHRGGGQAAFAAFSICRVMYHCWAMDSRLFTSQ